MPRTPLEPDIEQILDRAVSAALSGVKSPKQALDEANSEIEDLM
jgi:ABC-type glycerol-3-phosphate transport system substrate-binding protein